MINKRIKNFLVASPETPRLQSNTKGTELELMLYGDIGDDWYGIGPSSVAEQLHAAGDISGITVRINSRGGDVFDGATIYNLLASQDVPVNVIIDGLAASAASYIAMVGDTVTMGEGAMLMIHNPYCFALGNANELRKTADMLDKVRDSMLSGYMKRYSGTEDELKTALDAETWMTADDAKKAGLCDEIAGADANDDAATKDLAAAFDLTIFRNVPKNLKNAGRKKPKAAATTCPCPCGPCLDGNCSGCSGPDCNYPECKDCPQQTGTMDSYRMRLKLHERLGRS
ncbi:MAG TPA: head maturation protease, ClpP-related [Candidatus Angelobacter sp.]|jgi:ATP-dependent protease ClpP protease subunit